ncbi:MAG: hypothetical protein J5J00_13840 [Deltaproteobacteria bacterium]|nr:hypothetical protein [Deltaproteobacteria bacterium]
MAAFSSSSSTKSSFLFSLGVAATIVVLLSQKMRFWSGDGLYLWPSYKFALGASITAALAGIVLAKASSERVKLEPWGFLVVLAVLFLSDWLTKPYNLLQGPSIRGEILLFAALSFYLMRRNLAPLLSIAWILTAILLFISFHQLASGRLLFSDDHAVFQYRLELLKRNFPSIPFYEPRWNGGIDARDFFATGALNFFFLLSPLIYSFPTEKIYNLLVTLMFFFGAPALVYAAARSAEMSRLASSLAATLAITGNLLWYRWAFQYGTVGFLTSLSLVPLNLVLVSRALSDTKELSLKQAVTLGVTFSLMLMWSPSGLVFVPAILWGLIKIRTVLRKRYVLKLALFLLLFNVPWIVMFWSVSNVAKFVTHGGPVYTQMALLERDEQHKFDKASKLDRLSLHKSLEIVRENAVSWNPILFLLSLPGLYFLRRTLGKLLSITAVWLVIVGAGIAPINPRLEFERMFVVLAFMFSLPCGAIIARLLTQTKDHLMPRLQSALASLAAGFLLAGVLSGASVILNRTLVQYAFARPEVWGLCEAAPQFASKGRLLFSGFVLHELSDGHLAPLVNYCGDTEMMASSHVHNVWRYKQIVPAFFMSRIESGGVEEYLDLYNVESVAAHEKFWHDYFTARPEMYSPVWKGEKFEIFKRLNFSGSYVHEGQADSLSVTSNEIKFIARTPNIVLKYNYLPFVTASHCKVAAKEVAPLIDFIELTECPIGEEISVHSVSPLKRLQLEL